MRILHTSDWHIGKRLGRHSRAEDYEAVLGEVADIAEREQVDLVVVSGDVFDRPMPPVDALQLGLSTLVSLTSGGERPVVAVAGNHDSGDLFEALAPFLVGTGIHLVGHIKRPDDGGVLHIDTDAGKALVACFPFLREGRVVEFMSEAGGWYGQYAERVRRISDAYAEHLTEESAGRAVTLMVAHFMVTGARIGGHGVPRGERELHIGQAYAAAESSIPPTLSYVAMGHIHAPQPVPGANVPAEYAGSLLELDFGEAGEEKRVVIVEAEPGRPARVAGIPLTSGRRLARAKGTWDDLVARTDLTDRYLDLTVLTDGPDQGLADRAREQFPHLVKVRSEYERPESPRPSRGERPLDQLYAEYHADAHGAQPDDALIGAFREVLDEVVHAPS